VAYEEEKQMVAVDVAVWSGGLQDPSYPFSQLGRLSNDVSRKFRALGIMLLLSEGSGDLFLHHQIRSGRARIAYLKRAHQEGKTADFFMASGRYQPLLSAVAAQDWPLATEIAALSATQMLPGEYEDDHCVGRIVGLLIGDPPAPPGSLQPFLDRFEAYLEGASDARFDVLSAIVHRDQAAFDVAFPDLQAAFAARVQKDIERKQLEEPVTLALRDVDVDGLAFLQLAEHRGLTTESDYDFCPSTARGPLVVAFPGV
jgi:hypothetical protein